MPESRTSHLFAVLSLAAIAFVWAGGFPATKYCLQAGLSVGALLSIRFAIGTAGLGLMLLILKVPIRRRDALDGLWLGLVLVTLFWLQTDGLRFTTTSKSGFITGFYVIFTPMVALLAGDRLRPSHGLGALVALIGLALLVREPGAAWGGWNRGDSETLLAAVLCGFHIVMTAHFSRRSSGWVLAFIQVAVTGAVSLAITLALPAPFGFQNVGPALVKGGTWVALAFMGLLATTLAFMSRAHSRPGSAPRKAPSSSPRNPCGRRPWPSAAGSPGSESISVRSSWREGGSSSPPPWLQNWLPGCCDG